MLVHQNANSVGNYNYNAFIYDNCEWYYHFHNNFELVYILTGQIEAMVDSHSENLSSGDFALILPNQIHSFHTPQNSRVWIGVFSEDFVSAFSSQVNKKVGKQARFSCDGVVGGHGVSMLVPRDIRDVYLLKSCLYAVCDQYLRNASLIVKEYDDTLLGKIVDYISSNFRSNITLRQMAHDLGFEYHYLSRRFHDIFNMNFCRFVNQYRVNYANELLAKNSGSISDIAFESGFQTVRNFNHVYRSYFGAVPSRRYAGKL
jgi:AraC-like DNA-binding protein